MLLLEVGIQLNFRVGYLLFFGYIRAVMNEYHHNLLLVL